MNDSLVRLKSEISELKRNRKYSRVRPHKLVMLLTVLDLADQGLLNQNRIYFDETTVALFEALFDVYKAADDLRQPGPPFFHLRSSPFWHHKVKDGKESVYAKLSTSGGGTKRIFNTIDYAYLSDYAFEVVKQDMSRRELRAFIQNILESDG